MKKTTVAVLAFVLSICHVVSYAQSKIEVGARFGLAGNTLHRLGYGVCQHGPPQAMFLVDAKHAVDTNPPHGCRITPVILYFHRLRFAGQASNSRHENGQLI